MPHRFAGRFGPLSFTDLEGNADPGATIHVYLPSSTTHAALYTNRSRSGSPLGNPLPTGVAVGQSGLDAAGNAMFFVDPGQYDIAVTFSVGGFAGQTRTYKVNVDNDPGETLAIDAALLAGDTATAAAAAAALESAQTSLEAYVDTQIADVWLAINQGGGGTGGGWRARGQWSSGATYLPGDVVFYDGSSYLASEGVGPDPATPPENSAIWVLLVQGVSAALQQLINTHEARLDSIDQTLAGLGGGNTGGGGGITIATLPDDALIAYQGGSNIAPENTVESWRLSTAVGARGIHANVRRLADGTLVAFSDADVSRVTTGTGNVLDYTAPGWQPLIVDADQWFAPPWTGIKAVMLQRLFDDFGGRSMLVFEPATGGARSSLLTEIVERGLQNNCVIVCDDVVTVGTVKAAGCQALLRMPDTSAAPEALQSGADVLAAVDSISTADLTSLVGQMAAYPNVALWGWGVSSRRQRDRMRAAGVTALVTPEPGYLRDSSQIKKVSTWATQTYPHGLIPGAIDPRPKFGGTEQLRYDATDGQQWALLGEQGPILDDFTLDVEFQWGVLPAEASPLDRVGIAFCAANDDDFSWSGTLFDPATAAPDAVDRNDLRDCYLATFSKNGTVRLNKVDRGANTVTELANAAGTALVAGTYVTLRVQVSGGNVSASIVGTAATVTVADSSRRGGYAHLGKLGSAQSARFRNLAVTGVTVTPPAIPTTTLYAMRAAANDPNTTADTSTALKAWQNVNATYPTGFGPLAARRSVESFATGIPATWSVSAGSFDEAQGADPSLYSIRTNWQRMIDGTDDAALAAFINSIPSGHDVYIAWAPQADTFTDPLETNGLGAAGFVAGFQHFASVVKAQGRSNVHVMVVLNLRELIAAGNAEQWWPGYNAVDVVGIRAVNGFDPAASTTQWDLVDDLLVDTVAFAISHGKQWGIVEAGTRADPARPLRKSTWISNLGAWSEANPRALFISYANASPYWVRDTPDGADAFAELVHPGATGGGGGTATPPSFKAMTTVERSNVTSISFDLPAGIADGDECVLFVATGLNSPVLSDPTTGGWTSLGPQQNKDLTTRLATRAWRKKWHTGDPTTGVIPSDVSTRASVVVVTYGGAATADDVTATVVDTDTDNIVPSPGVTTTVDQDRVLRFFAHRGLATTWTAPAGTTVRAQQFASNAAGAAVLATDELAATAGAVGAKNATSDIANGYSIGWTVALKPSGTGGGGGGGTGTSWNVPAHRPFYGSSAGNDGAGGDTRSSVQCYTDLDSAVASAMGVTAPTLRMRHSFSPSFPSGFGGMPCSGDVGITPPLSASMTNFNLGYNTAYDGSKNAAIAALVNSFPNNDHTYYLIANHEPENDCGSNCEITATERLHWRAAQVHFIRTVLAQGKANVIPMTILMGWTFNPASGRNPDDYNMLGTSLGGFATPLTADEKVGFVWGVDAYQNSLSGTFLSTWQAAWNYGYTQGARRFGLGEVGFRSDGSTAADDAEENYFKNTTNNALFRGAVATWESTHSGAVGEAIAYWHSYIGGSTATARGVYTFHSNRVRKAFGDACKALQG